MLHIIPLLLSQIAFPQGRRAYSLPPVTQTIMIQLLKIPSGVSYKPKLLPILLRSLRISFHVSSKTSSILFTTIWFQKTLATKASCFK